MKKLSRSFSLLASIATVSVAIAVRGEDAGPGEVPDGWVPFEVEPNVEPGSALDFSWTSLDRAPCGASGRVVIRNGHFEYENAPGKRLRFWGANLSGMANFPDLSKVEEIADRFAGLGYNCIRLHHHDSGLVGGNQDSTEMDPENLRRMDALVDALSRRGIHVITDIYVSRPVSWRACGIDRDGTMDKSDFKHLVPIHEGAFSNWCEFAKSWLCHTNEFSGVRFADDPALIAVALVNEGNLDNGAGPQQFVSLPGWEEKWQAWLAAKRSATPDASKQASGSASQISGGAGEGFGEGQSPSPVGSSLREELTDIPDTIPEGNHWNRTRHVAAFSRFLAEVEFDFERRAVEFLRKEVGLAAPISNMSSWMQPPEYQIPLAGPYLDYVEGHSYMDHPSFPGKSWGLPCLVGNVNPVRQKFHSASAGAVGGTLKRIFGKPFCVTEFNFCSPNPHRGAGGLLFGAEAAAQDWDGAWRFDWASSRQGVEAPGTSYCGLFAVNCDPLRQASDRLAQLLFVRGDLAPCKDAYAVLLPPSLITGRFDGESTQLNTPWPELAWKARLGTVVAETAPAWTRWVDPYPEYYKRGAPATEIEPRSDIVTDPEAGSFRVTSPRTCAIFAEGGTLEAGALKVDFSGETGSATVWASVIDGAKSLQTSSRVLLGRLTNLVNSGMETEEKGDGASHLSAGTATMVLKWGGLPYLVRGGEAKVELALGPGNWNAWALSHGGRRVAEVPCTRTPDGHIAIALNTSAGGSATLFWELERQ